MVVIDTSQKKKLKWLIMCERTFDFQLINECKLKHTTFTFQTDNNLEMII